MYRFVAIVVLCLASIARAVPFAQAVESAAVQATLSGNGSSSVSLHMKNPGQAARDVQLAAGAVFASEAGEKQVLLRALEVTLAAGEEMDAVLPTAALSAKNTSTQRALKLAPAGEPRLASLLPLFAKQNDLPRTTAQLAVFAVMEDMSWDAWQKWLAVSRPAGKTAQAVSPAEVAQAVDSLALVKLSKPEKPPAILADEDLKRVALRNPWARGKAMALYGLSVDNALTGDPALPPDLGKLLHMTPNDNCPICRQRQKMEADLP